MKIFFLKPKKKDIKKLLEDTLYSKPFFRNYLVILTNHILEEGLLDKMVFPEKSAKEILPQRLIELQIMHLFCYYYDSEKE